VSVLDADLSALGALTDDELLTRISGVSVVLRQDGLAARRGFARRRIRVSA
jgi:hypothetical protein